MHTYRREWEDRRQWIVVGFADGERFYALRKFTVHDEWQAAMVVNFLNGGAKPPSNYDSYGVPA